MNAGASVCGNAIDGATPDGQAMITKPTSSQHNVEAIIARAINTRDGKSASSERIETTFRASARRTRTDT